MAEDIAAFAARAGKMRAARGWTLRQAAEQCGLNASTVLRAEQGRDVVPSNALLLANGYGLPLGDMLRAPACQQCADAPPPGFTCQACGGEGKSRSNRP